MQNKTTTSHYLFITWNNHKISYFVGGWFTLSKFLIKVRVQSWLTLIKMSRDMTKPTKWVCAQRRLRSAWASAQSDQSLRCAHEKRLVLSYPLSAQRRLWSDWAHAQADLSLRLAHSHFVGFFMSRLKCCLHYQSGSKILAGNSHNKLIFLGQILVLSSVVRLWFVFFFYTIILSESWGQVKSPWTSDWLHRRPQSSACHATSLQELTQLILQSVCQMSMCICLHLPVFILSVESDWLISIKILQSLTGNRNYFYSGKLWADFDQSDLGQTWSKWLWYCKRALNHIFFWFGLISVLRPFNTFLGHFGRGQLT